ncbi:competence/damage-inducible protein A [Virgibacillus sp. 179-BFC.A HS]|uniref:Putative competence-damage inducible protein n=1 Tax=Tigheibacillus jepli TaxID=3035914 RepID=A0ABU5CHI3_9BACI|nr:competence/damage-inducible protein A [Virgibacillus sp. 179-BFC.A HS]MDY0405814.1 competence/damage-inducible protein A [Virgibacillus sp. 179-BFC.A HS]
MTGTKAEIIAVGTELLLGQIANTNAQWISKQLAELGIDVHHHEVVGDNLGRVEAVFQLASQRSDIIIVTGGLGPTDDDLTREAFQLVSGLEMHEHKPSMDKIVAYFQKQARTMTPNNRKQARIFKGAEVLPNNVGMAPGMIVSHHQKTWIFMPGVPKEMKAMFSDNVVPYLKEKFEQKNIIRSLVLNFSGIGESQLEHELIDLIRKQKNPTIAPLAQEYGVTLRLTAKEKTKEKAEQLLTNMKATILDRVGEYYYGDNAISLEEKVVSTLKEKKWRIASAESLTGGMFAETITSVAGSSAAFRGSVVSYDPIVKREILHVSEKTIKQFGTVSKSCASEMAANAAKLLQADIGISFTGVAGPDSLEGNPVGTVFIGLANSKGIIKVEECHFAGSRQDVRNKSVKKGLEILMKYLNA